jgi:hypothetical protein
MTVRIVDRLEIIEIEEEQRGFAVAGKRAQNMVGLATKVGTVRKRSDGVEHRQSMDTVEVGTNLPKQAVERRRDFWKCFRDFDGRWTGQIPQSRRDDPDACRIDRLCDTGD